MASAPVYFSIVTTRASMDRPLPFHISFDLFSLRTRGAFSSWGRGLAFKVIIIQKKPCGVCALPRGTTKVKQFVVAISPFSRGDTGKRRWARTTEERLPLFIQVSHDFRDEVRRDGATRQPLIIMRSDRRPLYIHDANHDAGVLYRQVCGQYSKVSNSGHRFSGRRTPVIALPILEQTL